MSEFKVGDWIENVRDRAHGIMIGHVYRVTHIDVERTCFEDESGNPRWRPAVNYRLVGAAPTPPTPPTADATLVGLDWLKEEIFRRHSLEGHDDYAEGYLEGLEAALLNVFGLKPTSQPTITFVAAA